MMETVAPYPIYLHFTVNGRENARLKSASILKKGYIFVELIDRSEAG